jgi:hypothetical protein
MKLALSTAVLILLLGSTASAYAQEKGQEESKQEAKPAQQHAQQQAKPAQQHAQQQAKPAQQHAQQQAKPAQQHAQQQAKPAQQHAQQQAKPAQQHAQRQAKPAQQPAQQQARAQASQPAGGNRGNYAHGRISDDHYASSFGSEHRFHINRGDYDRRRFEYGGYSFGFVDPWPGDWAYSDDVYVVYVDNGYYMYDPVHPGVRISISIF